MEPFKFHINEIKRIVEELNSKKDINRNEQIIIGLYEGFMDYIKKCESLLYENKKLNKTINSMDNFISYKELYDEFDSFKIMENLKEE